MRARADASLPVDPAAEGAPPSPRPRRVRPPSWVDARLMIGVLLVLASVLVGARLIGDADESTTVWGVSRDLAAGTVLTADDLVEVRVRLYDNARLYLAASSDPAGKVLNRPILSGELLPTAALSSAESAVALPLSVPAERVPTELTRGGVVDVYASAGDPAQSAQTALVLSAVTVLHVDGRGDGALSVGAQRLQVLLSVPSCHVAQVIDATEGMVVSLAMRTGPPPESVTTVGCDEAASPNDDSAESSEAVDDPSGAAGASASTAPPGED